MAQDELGQRTDVVFVGIERRNVFEPLAARGEKARAVGDRDFLERLEAVDRETRAQHLHVSNALARHRRFLRMVASIFRTRLGRPMW